MADQGWALIDAHEHLQVKYHEANRSGALEWPAAQFWRFFLDRFAQDKGLAFFITAECPADSHPNADEKLRRVDMLFEGFDIDQKHRQFPLIFVEVKRASTTNSVYRDVEEQARNACHSYANSNHSHSNQVFAMCAVGTRARIFMRNSQGFQPVDGNAEQGSPALYVDAGDRRRGITILRQIETIIHLSPARLAPASWL